MFRVYISGPITAPTLEREVENVNMALEAAYQLVSVGLAVYLPHAFWFADRHMARRGHPPIKNGYLSQDIEWVKAVEAVLRLPGVSIGAECEVAFARTCGIPIYDCVSNVIKAAPSNAHFQGECNG